MKTSAKLFIISAFIPAVAAFTSPLALIGLAPGLMGALIFYLEGD